MSTFKTRIDAGEVDRFLSEKYAGKASRVSFIKGGEISQAFSFEIGSEGYIIRVNRHNSRGFEKDRYAYRNFHSSTLLIPEIVEIGKMGDNFFALSKKAQGSTIIDMPEREASAILPRFLEALDEIHSKDISSKEGYGLIDSDGKGSSKSWKAEVIGIANQDWQKRFEDTFMEKELYDKLFAKLQELIAFCPEERSLVHGDYSFDNVLSNGIEITGVIDWAQSMYGDFLYDIAWISFWPSSKDYSDRFAEHYQKKGGLPKNYRERVLCYQVWIALNSLGFYAYSNQKDKYEWARGRIFGLLK